MTERAASPISQSQSQSQPAAGEPAPGPRGWWARNRLWVYLLAPLLLLAVAASGFRFTRIYLPWDWTRPHVASGSTMTFTQDARGEKITVQRTVTITVLGATPVTEADGRVAVPGATLHRVDLEFAAAPEVPLVSCEVFVVAADGTLYSSRAGQLDAPGTSAKYRPLSYDCVPPDTPGPGVGEAPDPEAEPRPATWRVTAAFALPAGVQPQRVRVQWQGGTPDYAVVAIPG